MKLLIWSTLLLSALCLAECHHHHHHNSTSTVQPAANACNLPFQRGLIAAMDSKRRLHGAYELVNSQNQELEEYAQGVAEFAAGQSDSPPPPPPFPTTGYVRAFSAYVTSPVTIVNELYAAGADYPYYCQEPYSVEERYFGFTLMLWKSCTSISFGCARDELNNLYFAYFLLPPGNVPGQYADNVLPPGGHCPLSKSNSTSG